MQCNIALSLWQYSLLNDYLSAFSKPGKNNQEDCVEVAVPGLQTRFTTCHQGWLLKIMNFVHFRVLPVCVVYFDDCNWLCRGASISRSVVTRKERAHLYFKIGISEIKWYGISSLFKYMLSKQYLFSYWLILLDSFDK